MSAYRILGPGGERGAPFTNWTENAHRFAGMDALTPGDHKDFIRTLLYPARLVYSWSTGRMGSNDDAVAFTCEHCPRDGYRESDSSLSVPPSRSRSRRAVSCSQRSAGSGQIL
jgi:hypothetical protein